MLKAVLAIGFTSLGVKCITVEDKFNPAWQFLDEKAVQNLRLENKIDFQLANRMFGGIDHEDRYEHLNLSFGDYEGL